MVTKKFVDAQSQSAGDPQVVNPGQDVKGAHCLKPCPTCAKLGLRVGCNRQPQHAGVHHCSNYNQGPHEWE